jgi:16S rRNA (cytosine967-C5)-methyltransferase
VKPTAASKRRTGRAPGATALAEAARALAAVVRGRSAEEALARFDTAPERAAIRAITLGSVRWYLRLAPAVRALLATQSRALAPELEALLIAAAHQVEYSRNAPQAVVDAAVDAARVVGQARASGLVNAVLRRFVAERGALLQRLDANLAVASAHPGWLVEILERAWPAELAALLAGDNEHPPLTLRIDRTRREVAAYLDEAAAAGVRAHASDWSPAAVQLDKPVPVDAIPGFRQGYVSVQDAGAQLAAPLLGAQAGMRVLDACAAPGGKTLHVLEQTPDLAELLAVDTDEQRLARVRENLERAGRSARLAALDVRSIETVLRPAPFDRILVDAPCSSVGVIRRHPDIKLLRRPTDIAAFAAEQQSILRAAFRLLAPRGRLLYCTCSVLPEENEQVVEWLLQAESSARPGPLPPAQTLAPGAIDRSIGLQLLPGGGAGTDGFYYACIEKATAGH